MTAGQAPRGPGLEEAPAALAVGGWPAAPSSAVIPFEPRRRRAAAPGRAFAAFAEPLRVLVIDDEQEDFVLVRDLLARAEGAGFVADWASSAEAGLARLLAGGYDACLCDHRFQQGGDGVQLASEAQARGCRTPVILITGFAAPEVEIEAIVAGVVDLIEKEEFDTQRLDRALRFAAGRQRRLEKLGVPPPAVGDDLAGPALLADRLERALAAARRHRTGVAVVVVDPCGPAGSGVSDRDQILRAAARRLRDRVRETDTVGRTEGGELAVVLAGLGRPEDAALVPAKLLDALAVPVLRDDGDAGDGTTAPRVATTASLGVASFPRDGADAAELLRHAAAATHRARLAGGGACRFHDETGLETADAWAGGASRAGELRAAIERGELRLQFQPQVTLCAPELGLAALPCWQHPELGPVGGERLRRLAEGCGLLEPLTGWMMAAACRQAKHWRDAGLRRLHVAVPLLSRRQLAWSGLAARLEAQLRAEGLPPGWLELELDERLVLEELAAGGAALAPLRELGVRLALDGFGGGAASLTVLRDAPLRTLKLSRAFLQGTPGDERRTFFAGAVIGLAKRSGIRIVADGVEGQEQLQMLKAQGCDAVQSFISCPPLPAEACTDWLRQATQRP